MSNLIEKAIEWLNIYSSHKTKETDIFIAGYELCQKEYEEKFRWIPIEEKLPEFDNSKYPNGDFEKYEVKFCTGGISPKCFIQISHLIREDKFSGEFDWTRATHWRRIPFL